MATDPTEFTVEVDGGSTTARHFSGGTSAPLLVLAHGAGADQRHRFMEAIARRLSDRGVSAVTFNFLYTERKRRAPDRAPVLEATWTTVLDAVVARLNPEATIAIGGKSMGGRIASQVAASKPGSEACCLATLSIRPAGPRSRASRTCRRLKSPSCSSRARATRSALAKRSNRCSAR
jgi:predicted alpha/beta-hydrolase family hydrolase